MMTSRLLFPCLILLFQASVSAQEIQWRPSIEVAAAESESTGKPMLLHFSADWCHPCTSLKQFVLADTVVVRSVNEKTIPVLINTDSNPDLVKKYSIKNLPTDVFVVSGDRIAMSRVSPQDKNRWLEMLEAGLSASASMSVMDKASNDTLAELDRKWEASRTPIDDEFKIDDFHMQKPFQQSAELLLRKPSSQTNDPALADLQSVAPSDSVAARFSLPRTAEVKNSDLDENIPSATVAPTSEFYANSESGPTVIRNDENVLRNPVPESKPLSFSNPYITDNKGGDPEQPSITVKATASGHTDSVCLDGLCPVTVLEEGTWTAGNPTIGCVHRGRTYLFQTVEKRDRFLANPDRWSPVFAGYDPVDFAKTGRLIDGQRTFGIFMNTPDGQQVVLFSSAINQAQFKASAGKFMDAIQQATREADAQSAAMRR